jgi:glycine/D-amino acid oxidase-like deaminating enzyme
MTLSTQAQPMPPSLWNATATLAPSAPTLDHSTSCDVLIVGAGFTGLSTALHLAERGIKACVVDAAQPGWGASGRNGGQVIPGLKYDPDELVQRYGAEKGEALISLAGAAADIVFDLINKYDIRCHPVRKGWIQTADSPKLMETLTRRARQWERRNVHIELLDRRAVADRVGAEGFVGGWVDHRAGSIQPLSYAYGLATAAQSLGASLHGGSRATTITREGSRWRVTVANGCTIQADRVLIATNAYSDDLWPGLCQSILAVNSFLVATTPLDDALGESILKGGEVTSNSQRLLLYFRRDHAGRLVLGGRGPFTDPRSPSDWRHVERGLARLFPHLKEVAFEYRWAGRLAVTRDFMPHVHEPAPGITIALGYNGRGIAMATTMGKHIADRLAGTANSDFPYPISPIKGIPLHRLQRFYMAVGVAYYRLRDFYS